MTKDDDTTRAASYALGALSAEERAEFERDLRTNPALAAESREFTETAALLGLATAPVEAPASLRRSVLENIAAMPQQASDAAEPVAPVEPVETPDAAAPAPRVELTNLPPQYDPVPVPAPAAGPAERAAERRWYTRPVMALAGAAAAVALIAGGVAVGMNATGPGNLTVAEQLAAASDAQRSVLEVGDAQATLTWSESLGTAMIDVADMAAAPAGRIYQLWFIGADGARPAGTFDVSDGDATVPLSGTMHAGDTVGVTVEPAGGSETPTSDPIMVFETV